MRPTSNTSKGSTTSKENEKSLDKNILIYFFKNSECRETLGKSLRQVDHEVEQTLEPPFSKENLLDKTRRYLRTSKKDVVQAFLQVDTQDTGIITNIQFRHVLKSLGFGFNLKEIDELVNLCSQEG